MNMITFALCQEDRARLDKIIEALELVPAVASGVAQDVPKNEPKEENAEKAELVEEVTETVEETPAVEPTNVVSLSDIQKKVVELSAAGKKAEVRDIITKYANRVSAIPAEHTAEVWNQLTGLES